ncbi:MAG TPA: S-layer homology domain-containing protein, partial [Egicoccus sp.]
GDARIGQTLTVTDPDVNWTNNSTAAMTPSYQWQADGVDIAGATGTSLVVAADHVGARLRVLARRTNDVGTTTATSAASSAVPAVPLLSGLTTSAGALAPVFDAATTSYAVTVPMATSSLQLTPATATHGATITVAGSPVTSGTAAPVTLTYGRNEVSIVVSGSGDSTTYRVTITRPSPAPAPAPTPTTPTPPVPVRDPVGQLPQPGAGQGTVGGQRVALEVAHNSTTRGVDVRGPGFELEVAPATGATVPGLPTTAVPPGERPAADLTFTRGEGARVAVRGFAARTPVRLWLFSEPTLLGEFETDAAGALAAVSDLLGDDIPACRHTVHAEGQLPGGEAVELSLGVWVDAKTYPYADVAPQSDHARAVACLRDLDVIRGTGADAFDPAGDLQRGQAATLVARLLDLPLDGTPDFADAVGSTHRGGIAAAAAAELVSGFADGSFRPGAAITRGQLASLLAAAAGLDHATPSAFDDTDRSAHAGAVAALVETGIVGGFGDGTFRPGQPVSRDQAASMLHRFVEWRETD